MIKPLLEQIKEPPTPKEIRQKEKKRRKKYKNRIVNNFNPRLHKKYTFMIKKVRKKEKKLKKIRTKRDMKNDEVRDLFAKVKEFRTLRDELNVLVEENKIKRDTLNNEISRLDTHDGYEIKKMRNEARKLHSLIEEDAADSQKYHKLMLEHVKSARATRDEADGIHTKVKNKIAHIKKIRNNIKTLQAKMKTEYNQYLELNRCLLNQKQLIIINTFFLNQRPY